MKQAAIDFEFHPLADIFPLLDTQGAEFKELADSIEKHGLEVPIEIYDNMVLDGRNRYNACTLRGVEPKFKVYTGDHPLQHIINLNLHRRHLNESQRAMVAANIARTQSGRPKTLPIGRLSTTTEEAAKLLNVSQRSVNRAKNVKQDGVPKLVEKVEKGELKVSTAADIATLPKEEQEKVVEMTDDQILKKAKEIRSRKTTKALHSSESNEWYTPSEYIEAARATMGSIDLDPASSEEANETVKAAEYYTVEDDGFEQEWHGNDWLNPPYGRHSETNESNQARWTQKLIDEYENDHVSQAVALVNAATDTNWFHDLWKYPLCFLYNRVAFNAPEGAEKHSPTHGNAIVYMGDTTEGLRRFVENFSPMGKIVLPHWCLPLIGDMPEVGLAVEDWMEKKQ